MGKPGSKRFTQQTRGVAEIAAVGLDTGTLEKRLTVKTRPINVLQFTFDLFRAGMVADSFRHPPDGAHGLQIALSTISLEELSRLQPTVTETHRIAQNAATDRLRPPPFDPSHGSLCQFDR
jgi:hypothetical protein